MISIQERALIAGRYRLERPLARGGMGSVWVARHVDLDVEMAIKFMDEACAASSEGRARFAREARAAAQLRSPHVVQVHDYGVEEGTPYLVMELLEGEHLGARLKQLGRLRLPAAQAIVTQLAKALRRAHDAGIVHRDLKPSNVFLARHGADEIVKVLDFGIAKSPGASLLGEGTRTGAVMGSPHYMSPEQARDSKRVDARSDLWSLGVVAFRALTGELPFPGNRLLDVMVKLSAGPIPAPSSVAPHLGPEVDRFFERALSREPSERFQSAEEMAEAFSALTEPQGRLLRTSFPPPLSISPSPLSTSPSPLSSFPSPLATERAPELHTREPHTRGAPAVTSVTAVRDHRSGSRAIEASGIMDLTPVTWATARSQLKTSFRAPSIVVVEFSGHLCADGVRRMIDSVTPLLARGRPVQAFNDWEGMTGYESDARRVLSEWVRDTGGFTAVHILVRSKLVAMGVAVANLAVGGTIVSYTSRSAWQARMDELTGAAPEASLRKASR